MIKKLLQDACGVPQLMMEHYGYKAIVWDHMQSSNVSTVQDDGYQIEIEWDQVMNFVRNVPVMVVDSELIAESLCNQGIYAYVDEKSNTEFVYKDLVATPNHMVAFAKEITVNGTPVSWLLYDSEPRMSCSGAWDENFEDDGEYVVEAGDIADELLQNALKIGAPQLVRKDEIRNALGELAEMLSAARSKLRHAKEHMQRIADSDEKNPLGDLLDLVWNFSKSTTMVFDAVDELNNNTCEAVQCLSQEVDTAFLNPSPNRNK